MRLLFQLFFDLVVRAGRIGDVETALFVEIRHDRAIDEWRAGDQIDVEAGGK